MRWKHAVFAGIVVVPAIMLTVAGVIAQRPVPPTRMQDPRDCPHDFSVIVGGVPYAEVPLAGERTPIPMYHDCQRLLNYRPLRVTKAGRVTNKLFKPVGRNQDRGADFIFGPLVGLYVSQRLNEFVNDARNVGGTIRITYELARSIVNVDSSLVVIDTSATPDNEGRGVAVIQFYNHGPGRYPALGIGPNFTCLYLINDPYQAWAINTNTVSECGGPFTQADLQSLYAADRMRLIAGLAPNYPRVTPLIVHPRSPSNNPNDYANVGRFDWNHLTREHFITIRCGPTTWCDIGRTPPPVTNSYVGTPAHLWQIKGWHDEQRMTNVTAANPTVADYRATIVPSANLATIRVNQFTAGWVDVAEVFLTQASPLYKTKLNFDPALPGQRPNVIAYRVFPDSADPWRARIISATGDTVFKKVWRRPAPDTIPVPPTARWRWLFNDETVWTKCDAGCCEIIA